MLRRTEVRVYMALIISLAAVFVWSAIAPRDRGVWYMEVATAVIGVAVLASTFKRFEFSLLVYILVWVHAVILLVGGHYTYEHNPLFDWISAQLGWQRNYYDRVGHFAQGFVPAIIVREILVRVVGVKKTGWLWFLSVCVCLAASAFWEFIEWWAAVLNGAGDSAQDAERFLGSQGDPWDTQWDMFTCFVGANLAMMVLGRVHDGSIARRISGVASPTR
jgi:putative membrane protein